LVSFLTFLVSTATFAQTANDGLTSDFLRERFNSLEDRSAEANQSVYGQLVTNAGCTDTQQVAGGACSGQVFVVFEEVRELVHTANALNGAGPTAYSLGLDAEGLGFALRWTAGEELAAQGSSVKQFTNGQLASLTTRITALRQGARRELTSNITWDIDTMVASNGAVSPEPVPVAESSIGKRWGFYLDSSYGYGDKDDTTSADGFENAFDFDSQEITLGADYRVTNGVVMGVLAGYTDKEVDFDSSLSVVDGGIKSDGGSLLGYTLWESDRFFVVGALGGQWLSHDTTRRITYPSFNPIIPSTNETSLSSADSTALIASLNGGVDFRFGGFTVEPYVKLDYQDITIDGFTESEGQGFDLKVSDQNIESLDGTIGLRLQYVWTPSFGVVIPYVRGEFHRQFEDEIRLIRATYLGIAELQEVLDLAEFFVIPTDEVDDQFAIYSAGFSMVVRNGWQGFLQYQQVSGLDDFSEQGIIGGVRFEF